MNATEKRLTAAAQADRDEFISEYGRDVNCFCHLDGAAPCGSCMHPGNPAQQAENPSCREGGTDSQGGETDVSADGALVDAEWYEVKLPGAPLADTIDAIRAAIGDNGCLTLSGLVERVRAIYDLGEAHKNDCFQWETRMMKVIGEDGVGSVADAIDRLRVEKESARSELMETEADLVEVRDALAPFWPNYSLADADVIALAKHAATELRTARALNAKLEHLITVERQTSAALREQLAHVTTSDKPAAPGLCASQIDSFAVIAPKRPILRFTRHDSAVRSAMAAAKNGSGRGDVFALVPVGVARRGAVWSTVE